MGILFLHFLLTIYILLLYSDVNQSPLYIWKNNLQWLIHGDSSIKIFGTMIIILELNEYI